MLRPRSSANSSPGLLTSFERSKALSLLIRPRIPWKVQHLIDSAINTFYYCLNRLYHRPKLPRIKPSVTVACGFHGRSGGVTAIANLTNMLSAHYGVDFVTSPTSTYNRLLRRSVHMVNQPAPKSPVLLCDMTCGNSVIRSAKAQQQTVIVTCHKLLDVSHGFADEYVHETLLLADLVHFTGRVQQDSFKLPADKCRVIPNFTYRIRKTIATNCVGIVGRLKDPNKNTKEAIEIALKSEVDCIHLWGNAEHSPAHPRVKSHPWTSNKESIFNSFDVLVHLSKRESFGMVVIEAMSAGLPCLLSSIPAFEQFRCCPGIRFVDQTNREQAPGFLNELLEQKDMLKPDIVDFWEKHFSEEAVAQAWLRLIDETCSGYAGRGSLPDIAR